VQPYFIKIYSIGLATIGFSDNLIVPNNISAINASVLNVTLVPGQGSDVSG
jgi:hypothetical protein